MKRFLSFVATSLLFSLFLAGCNSTQKHSIGSSIGWDNPENWGEHATASASSRPRLQIDQDGAGITRGLRSFTFGAEQSPPKTAPVNYDEVWIIEKARPALIKREVKGCRLVTTEVTTNKEIPLPLEHTEVKGRISGYIAQVDVKQRYTNPYATKIEAVYTFPLPDDAAVTDFIMQIGERKIRGLIREKEDAIEAYENARRQGHVASLMTQQRPNVFTQKVANIEPGKKIDISLTYFNTLRTIDGAYEFVFPMVVGPRYRPGNVDVSYLKPNERSGHDIQLTLDIDAGLPIHDLHSPSHVVKIEKPTAQTAQVSLSPNDRVPNKDFVLRYRLADQETQPAMIMNRSPTGNTFALMLEPPADLKNLPRQPREMIFVVDVSGSMSGGPLNKAKDAMRRCIRGMDADDTFQIVRFSSKASQLGNQPLPATPKNIAKGLRYIDKLHSGGGTEMSAGIRAALGMHHDPKRLRMITFMTDGFIGNEREIFELIDQQRGEARIFSFGIGSSVNRHLIEGMARVGNGAAAYVGVHEGAGKTVDAFYQSIAYPALLDVKIEWGAMQVKEQYPSRVPDLLVGHPLLISGRFTGNQQTIHVSGTVGGERIRYPVTIQSNATQNQHPGVAFVWARNKMRALSENYNELAVERREAMISLSEEQKILCEYTAFLAVDSLSKTAGDFGTTVKVPVPVPDGVRYETTVNQ